MAVEAVEYTGTCDVCGKDADARIEDCHTIFCTANCHREGGDLYHADCLKKFIASGAKGTAKHIPKIPYSNFPCPKGKGRGSADTTCKGVAAHCKRVIVKAEPKVTVPPQVLLLQERRPKPQPKPAPANKNAAPPKPAKPKAPPISDFTRIRLPPMPTAPKPDPLGRNLNGKTQQELPPGYVEAGEAEAERIKSGKSAKKNQKRAAKRKDEVGSQWDASSTNGSMTDTSGMPPLEEVLGPSPSQASIGSGAGWSNNDAAAGGEGDGSVASGSRFVTDIDRYHALLAHQMGYSDSSDIEYEDSEEPADAADSAASTPWNHPHQANHADHSGWQDVGARGRAAAPAAPAAASTRPQQAAPAADDAAELRRREEEQLKAVLEASLSEGAVAQAQVGEADEYEAALRLAMQESLAAEEAQRQQERDEQVQLLATFEGGRQPLGHGLRQSVASGATGAGAGLWGGAASADSSTAWGTAAPSSDAAAAAAAWGVAPPSVQQQQTSYQQQPQPAHTYSSTYSVATPGAAAGHPYAATPATVPFSASSPAYTAQAAYAASATPTPVAATYTVPAAKITAYQPAASLQQQQVPVPWLQPAAATAAAAAPAGYVAPAAAAAAEDDDDDDLDSLLALLDV